MAANNMPQKKEEYITNKVLAVFSLCLGGVLLLMGVERLVNNGTSFLTGMMTIRALLALSVVGLVVGLFRMSKEKRCEIDTQYKIICGKNIVMVFAVATVIMSLTLYYVFPIFKVFYALLPAIAVYYLIFHSYQPEFFVVALDGGIAVALLLIARRAHISANVKFVAWVALGVMVIIAAYQLFTVAKIKAKNGKLTFLGQEYSFRFSKNAYTMMNVTPVIMAALVAIGAAGGAAIAFYAIFPAAAYLFVTAVYYTVKLM